MDSYIDLQCWEIMKCNNLDCLARSEPETPCWEIAKRIGAYCDISNTCRDCIVYLLKEITTAISQKELQEILKQRGLFEKIGTDYPVCSLKEAINY
ncbi:MAG: hypothetical protein P8Y08_13115 [Desulfobulbaceae bacterium]